MFVSYTHGAFKVLGEFYPAAVGLISRHMLIPN